MTATVYEIKCGNCGFEAQTRNGSLATSGKFFMFFGCPTCKKIMTFCLSKKGEVYIFLRATPSSPSSFREMSENDTEGVIKKGICPECKRKMIKYRSKEQYQKMERHGGFTCPKCGKSALQMERTLNID